MIIKLIPLSVALLALIQPLHGQSAPSVRAEVRLLAFSDEIQPREVFMQDPSGPADAVGVKVVIKSYLNHEFDKITLVGRKVAFTTKPDHASLAREGELVGEVTLPANGDSSILIFLPGRPAKAMFQVMPIADSKKAFPAGSFNITNISPFPVRLMLEDKNFDFKPGQPILIQDPPVRATGQVGMRAFVFMEEKWKSLSTGLWSHPGKARGVMILFQDPKSKEVQLQAFDDVPPRTAAEETSPTP